MRQVQLARDKSFLNPRSWTCAECGFTDSVWVMHTRYSKPTVHILCTVCTVYTVYCVCVYVLCVLSVLCMYCVYVCRLVCCAPMWPVVELTMVMHYITSIKARYVVTVFGSIES